MIDCYRVLGVSPHASQADIRAAYISRMKVLHPDARSASGDAAAAAGEITAAYWQVRTRERRIEHDRRLFASPSIAETHRHPPAWRRSRLIPIVPLPPPRPPRADAVSRVLFRTALGMVALALAAPAGLFWFAHLNPIESARASAAAGPVVSAVEKRRPLDGAMRAAAADDFGRVLRDFGMKGADAYSRRCLAELSARASMSMLDYCIAFDDAAANWERPRDASPSGKSSFAADRRADLYREIAGKLGEPDVRGAMVQEANFFSRQPLDHALRDEPVELTAF
ncbi:MAG TPA: DnaJ domain-containing protein [Allosphingosinicella sp.]|jgi:curved DNA-binding protein CbpA|nr:DnaJ domain-containing protein [Allosphingosinicella sp.]